MTEHVPKPLMEEDIDGSGQPILIFRTATAEFRISGEDMERAIEAQERARYEERFEEWSNYQGE